MWKILICDDEAMTRRGLTKMIGHCRKDMEVVGAAAQGEEACAMIEQLRPSIVFMDINMPLVSGLEVIERYHEDPRLRFVIISGYSDFEYAQKACRYHVVDYLLKPVTEEQLSAVLDRCAAMLQQEITTSRIVVPQHQDRRMITQAQSALRTISRFRFLSVADHQRRGQLYVQRTDQRKTADKGADDAAESGAVSDVGNRRTVRLHVAALFLPGIQKPLWSQSSAMPPDDEGRKTNIGGFPS